MSDVTRYKIGGRERCLAALFASLVRLREPVNDKRIARGARKRAWPYAEELLVLDDGEEILGGRGIPKPLATRLPVTKSPFPVIEKRRRTKKVFRPSASGSLS